MPPRGKIRRGYAHTRNKQAAVLNWWDQVWGYMRKVTDTFGTSHPCPRCYQEVLERHTEKHALEHMIADRRAKARRGDRKDTPVTIGAPTVLPRRASKAKTAKRSATRPPGRRPVAAQTGGGRLAAVPAIPAQEQENDMAARGPRISSRTTNSGGTTPGNGRGGGSTSTGTGRHPLGPAEGVAKGAMSWAGAEISSVTDLEAQLKGMNAAMEVLRDAIGDKQGQIINMRIHPDVAAHLQTAADGLVQSGLDLVSAYTRFEQIYSARLDYERNQQHKPDEKLFAGVS